jgi:nitronate monooxygenase
MWPDRRLLDLFKIDHPIVLAPMAGAVDAALVIAVAEAGGLGSLPVALFNEQQMRTQFEKVRAATRKPINLNFFCHTPPVPSNAREHAWRETLKPYYVELGVDPAAPVLSSNRTPFDAGLCAAVEDLKPEIVSCHGIGQVHACEEHGRKAA